MGRKVHKSKDGGNESAVALSGFGTDCNSCGSVLSGRGAARFLQSAHVTRWGVVKPIRLNSVK